MFRDDEAVEMEKEDMFTDSSGICRYIRYPEKCSEMMKENKN